MRALVGQLVNAKAVVDELVRMQALDEDAQDTFMNAVLHDEHLQAHPPSSKYLKSLLRLYARGMSTRNSRKQANNGCVQGVHE